MSLKVKEGIGPFVIDRALPRTLFNRAPGNLELVTDDGEQPKRFATAEDAKTFLDGELDEQDYRAYDWTILPESATEQQTGAVA